MLRKMFCLLIIGFVLLSSCETEPLPVPPSPPPPIGAFDGRWQVFFDFDGDGLEDATACFAVQSNQVVSFYDACQTDNLVVSPAGVSYDNIGPYFAFYWDTVGDVVFYFAKVTNDYYDAQFNYSAGIVFGHAERR